MAGKYFAGGKRTSTLYKNITDSSTTAEIGKNTKGGCFPFSYKNPGKGVQNLQEEIES